MSGEAPSPVLRGKWRRFVPGCAIALLAGFALFVTVLLIGYRLYQTTPPAYLAALDRRAASTAASRYVAAESLEKRLSAELTFTSYIDDHGRPLPDTSDTRFIMLASDEINAWLDQRLPLWLKNRAIQLPAEVSDAAFWTHDDRLVLGVRVRHGTFDRVVTFAMHIDIPQDGDAAIRLVGVRVGRLPLPLSVVRGRIDDEAGHVAALIDGFTFPTRQVIGGQAARWVAIEPVDGGLLIELERESP